jgi:hypothetical protein
MLATQGKRGFSEAQANEETRSSRAQKTAVTFYQTMYYGQVAVKNRSA